MGLSFTYGLSLARYGITEFSIKHAAQRLKPKQAAYADVFDAGAQGLAWRNHAEVHASIKASSISATRTRLSWPIFKNYKNASVSR